ncbi:anaerobic ribonucleoside-triphosphate reductase activating protein [Aureivirga sp. CE67]|uniref:anaerobic ribonucleoside-triphosphate reductase activating protein n=1 Tax=Aureivirga sp. CE67 TaxID=1788983 RepID=UPI0018CB5E12|nr:anaerobic ribonucleoside-triphosphate reductase activating protein [Aureivirga sp. CE67]
MNYKDIQIVFQEVPGQISICFTITGCSLHCKGCHSKDLWKKSNGSYLSKEKYLNVLKKYQGFATCVLFMGGEWHNDELIDFLKIAKKINYKTCLYTGEEEIKNSLLTELTWLKTGAWNENLGGLDSIRTNQKFIEVKTQKKLNHLFLKL